MTDRNWRSTKLVTRLMVAALAFELAIDLGLAALYPLWSVVTMVASEEIATRAVWWLAAANYFGAFATYIAGAFWLTRVSANAGVSWSMGWYVFPMWALYKPYRHFVAIWMASGGAGLTLLRLWWGACLIATAVAVSTLGGSVELSYLSAFTSAVATGLLLVIALKIRILQEKHRTAGTAAPPAPPRFTITSR